MQAINRPFTTIINGTTQFVIPVFQRDYSWAEEHCERLWTDVLRIGGQENAKHFMGSVVYAPSGDSSAGFTRWLLIDGQQRVTTLTLLILALRDHMKQASPVPADADGPTSKKLDRYFLKNDLEEGERACKLVLRRHDQHALRGLLDGDDSPSAVSSRVLDNYEFFRERVGSADPAKIYNGITRLVVVDVKLDADDDPQMVFESLNSTGLDLSQADLIRNYILMRLPEREQTELYEKYWSRIEGLFRDASLTFDAFARDYMALRGRATKQTRADRIYIDFQDYFRGRMSGARVDSGLEDMLRCAGYYAAFVLNRGAPDIDVAARMRRLVRMAEASAVLVMRLSELHHSQGTLSRAEFIAALELLESYVFRRSICGLQTRAYWQTFAALAHRVRDAAPLESLMVALRRLREAYRFPADAEFERALCERDVYGMRHCHYLLDRLENHGSKEQTDTSKYTVEHILPQNERPSVEWKEMLGESWQQVQRTWLHRLGNLTLTGYNSEYSDRPFVDKKTIAGGFNDSSVRLNKFVREQAVWTANQIQERGVALAGRALAIWAPLTVDEGAVRKAEIEDLRMRAGARDVSTVPMSGPARALFDLLRPHLLALGAHIVEVPEGRSISYHAADFFLEVLPRKYRLVLLLDLDFSECAPDSQTADATAYKFLSHASHEGGVVYHFNEPKHLDGAMRMIRAAHDLSI